MIRLFDIIFSFCGLLILSPIILILYLIGLFDTGSPIFQPRTSWIKPKSIHAFEISFNASEHQSCSHTFGKSKFYH
jgi:O-antigen biosynthesis protein WbqP